MLFYTTPLDDQFFIVSNEIRSSLKVRPTDEELLCLYGLYKQATLGNNTTSPPSIFNLRDDAKWKSWKSFYGKTKKWAKEEYIQFSKELMAKYSYI